MIFLIHALEYISLNVKHLNLFIDGLICQCTIIQILLEFLIFFYFQIVCVLLFCALLWYLEKLKHLMVIAICMPYTANQMWNYFWLVTVLKTRNKVSDWADKNRKNYFRKNLVKRQKFFSPIFVAGIGYFVDWLVQIALSHLLTKFISFFVFFFVNLY